MYEGEMRRWRERIDGKGMVLIIGASIKHFITTVVHFLRNSDAVNDSDACLELIFKIRRVDVDVARAPILLPPHILLRLPCCRLGPP